MLVDLAHLDRIDKQWTSVVDRIKANATSFEQAIRLVFAPAWDEPSKRQTVRYVESLELALRHCLALSEYATDYLDQLTASRAHYLAVEQKNIDELRRLGGG
ncbi:hypothetical protein [Actinophytocola sediminis]